MTDVFHEVQKIIVEQTGLKADAVLMDSDLLRDLGIAGDDGDVLIEALAKRFDVDWSELDPGVIFGNEGFGPPPPWMLRNNCEMYERQSYTVSDIIKAIETGKWVGRKLELKPKINRLTIYAKSFVIYGGLLMGLVFVIWVKLYNSHS